MLLNLVGMLTLKNRLLSSDFDLCLKRRITERERPEWCKVVKTSWEN